MLDLLAVLGGIERLALVVLGLVGPGGGIDFLRVGEGCRSIVLALDRIGRIVFCHDVLLWDAASRDAGLSRSGKPVGDESLPPPCGAGESHMGSSDPHRSS